MCAINVEDKWAAKVPKVLSSNPVRDKFWWEGRGVGKWVKKIKKGNMREIAIAQKKGAVGKCAN